MKRLTTEEFIKRCKDTHNDKYDYSLVEYINFAKKVIIICPKHGEFYQRAQQHLLGYGCRKCSIDKHRLTTSVFIKRSNKIHNFKYDYSKVNYHTSNEKVLIVCSRHGEFYQTPNSHLSGHGCDKCARSIKSGDVFINEVNKIHNFKYDYSNTIYKGSNELIEITCPKHGIFKQIANNHRNGQGCSKCSIENKRYSLNDFIMKSNKIHNNFYDYSLVNIINVHTDINIVCPKHGNFSQSPNNHLSGKGCSKCNFSKGEKRISKILERYNIIYEIEKSFENCKNIFSLKFDFYLPKYNVCIEYDGIQHFKPVDYFGGVDALKKRKELDNVKDKYCEENNIYLIRIPYYEFKNIDTIIKEKIINALSV